MPHLTPSSSFTKLVDLTPSLDLSFFPLYQQESASGILYLHTVGIIHRDIKPANILIGGKAKTAKIADFGISRIADVNATMTIKGTLLYQSPELSRGERYGFPADVYSFAITMYELCDRVSLSRRIKYLGPLPTSKRKIETSLTSMP